MAIKARGCRAAYFGPWVRWGRWFGWGALSVVSLFACSRWVAACWLFLVLSKERRRGRATHPGDHHEIYDIGTKILYFQCFVTTDMFLFCKPIFLSGNCRIYRDLAFGSVKTRFKAFWDIFSKKYMLRFSWTFAPGGRLSYEAYGTTSRFHQRCPKFQKSRNKG